MDRGGVRLVGAASLSTVVYSRTGSISHLSVWNDRFWIFQRISEMFTLCLYLRTEEVQLVWWFHHSAHVCTMKTWLHLVVQSCSNPVKNWRPCQTNMWAHAAFLIYGHDSHNSVCLLSICEQNDDEEAHWCELRVMWRPGRRRLVTLGYSWLHFTIRTPNSFSGADEIIPRSRCSCAAVGGFVHLCLINLFAPDVWYDAYVSWINIFLPMCFIQATQTKPAIYIINY